MSLALVIRVNEMFTKAAGRRRRREEEEDGVRLKGIMRLSIRQAALDFLFGGANLSAHHAAER